jgi:hypothetical protein
MTNGAGHHGQGNAKAEAKKKAGKGKKTSTAAAMLRKGVTKKRREDSPPAR